MPVGTRQRVGPRLVSIKDASPWLRFNPHVHGSYRPPCSFWACSCSVTSLHNESFNVWSHLIALGVFVAVPLLEFSKEQDMNMNIAGTSAAIALMYVGSVAYHLYMPYCDTAVTYDRLLKFDVVGAVMGITFSACTFLHHGYKCQDDSVRWVVFNTFILSFAITVWAALFSSSPKQRFGAIGIHCVIRTLSSIPSLFAKAWYHAHYASCSLHFLGFLTLGVGGYINTARVPEAWYPGKFDLAFNSHNIWHIAVFASSLLTLWGAWHDEADWNSITC